MRLLFFLSLLSFSWLTAQTSYTTEDGDVHLLGTFEREKIANDDYPWYKMVYDRYTVQEEVDQLNKFYDSEVRIDVYLGTWCGDSKREVTRFLKIVDESELSMDQVRLIGLDNRSGKTKQGPDGEEVGLNIHRVPTFIFKKDGEEIGRIVEFPASTLEMDIAQIMAGLPPRPNYRLANYLLDQFDKTSIAEVDTLITKYTRSMRRFSKNEGELNTLGYVLLAADKIDEAVVVFKLNTLLYPEKGNPYDSYGEALLLQGNTELAVINYLKAIQLDPENEHALEVIANLVGTEDVIDTNSGNG